MTDINSFFLLLVLVCGALEANDCQPSCFNRDYSNCTHDDIIDAVQIVLVTPSAPNWTEGFYEAVLMLTCEDLGVSDEELCWTGDVIERNVDCSSSCNCTTVQLSVFRESNAVVPSTVLRPLLESTSSKLALRMVGFSVLEVRSTGGDALFDVPIVSWVFVGLGVLFSFIFISQPAWWGGLRSCWRWLHKSCSSSSSSLPRT